MRPGHRQSSHLLLSRAAQHLPTRCRPSAAESFLETDNNYLAEDAAKERDDGCTAVIGVVMNRKLWGEGKDGGSRLWDLPMTNILSRSQLRMSGTLGPSYQGEAKLSRYP